MNLSLRRKIKFISASIQPIGNWEAIRNMPVKTGTSTLRVKTWDDAMYCRYNDIVNMVDDNLRTMLNPWRFSVFRRLTLQST